MYSTTCADTVPAVSTQQGDWTAAIRGARFTTNGRYICGYVDSGQELMQVLENYRTITGTGFSNAQSLSSAMKHFEDSVWQQRFMSPSARPRLFWQMNAGEPAIPYEAVPFMSVGQTTELPCVRYGGRRKKIEQVAITTGELVSIDYRTKTGCEAKITVRRILRYPCAEIPNIEQQGIAAVRRMRKQVLEDLQQKIVTGLAKPVDRYYFLLPTPLAHTGHLVPEIDSAPPLTQAVCDEIINQLSRGITDIANIREHIKNFVDTLLGDDVALNRNDPSYYPSEYDIFRHVYWLYKTGQVIDQESAFKAKLSLPNMEQECVPVLHTSGTPSKLQPTSDAMTSVYSIIMDDGGDGAATLHLSESQIRATGEVELNSTEDTHTSVASLSETRNAIESPIPTQIQIPATSAFHGSSLPVSSAMKKKPALVGTAGISVVVSYCVVSVTSKHTLCSSYMWHHSQPWNVLGRNALRSSV